jgi:hypothetical protein
MPIATKATNTMQTSQLTCTVDGIKFTYGESNTQTYWETEHRGIYYAVLQLKGTNYWAIVALERTTSRLLNGAVRRSDGQLHCDPLYSHHELTLDGWLSSLANYLNNLSK